MYKNLPYLIVLSYYSVLFSTMTTLHMLLLFVETSWMGSPASTGSAQLFADDPRNCKWKCTWAIYSCAQCTVHSAQCTALWGFSGS